MVIFKEDDDDGWEENPPTKSPEQRRKEHLERQLGEAKARAEADPRVGMCFVGARTTIANLDGIEAVVDAAKNRRKIPKEFDVGYKVYITWMNKDAGNVTVTSGRKLSDGSDWKLTIKMSNLQCFNGGQVTPAKPRVRHKPGAPAAPAHSPEGLEALFDEAPAAPRPVPAPVPEVPPAGDFEDVFGGVPPTPVVAPPAVAARKSVVLLISIAQHPVGTKTPVLSEDAGFYNINLPPLGAIGMPKSREGTEYRIEMEEAEIPLPPAPEGAPVAPPAPQGVETYTKPWQFVETPEAKARREDLKNPKTKDLIAKLPKIYEVLGDHFQWNKDYDRDVLASVFLIPNSSLVLKGVPGTGKTQLIEMATLMFANDFKLPGVNLDVYDEIKRKVGSVKDHRRFMSQWLCDRGVLGSVKHNADKQIQDVFFFTNINIEKFNMPRDKKELSPAPKVIEMEKEREVPKPPEIVEAPVIAPVAAPAAPIELAPAPIAEEPELIGAKIKADLLDIKADDEDIFGFKEAMPNPLPKKWEGTFNDQPDSLEIYDISPVPRNIVYSLIKFHNEANRMNANVADVLLGLMSEQEVEYHGRKFVSPVKWDETKGLLFDAGSDAGSISFFDYNPHLEVENPNMELDRALLDRITAGFYLSGGNTAMRFQIMDKKSKGIKQPREMVYQMLINGEIDPITRNELKDLWELVNGSRGGNKLPIIPIDAEVMAWIAWMTNLPNLTNKMYGGAYQGENNGRRISGQPIDRTLATFEAALERLDDLRPASGGIAVEDEDRPFDGIQVAIAELKRPLGVRSAESMVSMLRALTFLKKSAKPARGQLPKDWVIYCKTERDRDEIFDTLCNLLPYILDHRINLGVGAALKTEFLSTFDVIQYYFVPAMKAQKGVLYSIMDGLMAVYVENMKRRLAPRAKMTDTEKAEMFQRVLAQKLSERAPNVNFQELIEAGGPNYQSLVQTLMDLLGAM